MLGVERLPKGVVISRPPAKGVPPGRVWQAMQSARRAMYWPLAIRAGSGAARAAPIAGRLASSRPRSIQHARRSTDHEGFAARGSIKPASLNPAPADEVKGRQ